MSAQLKQISQNVMALSGDIDRDTVPELWKQFQSVSFGSPHFELTLEKVNRFDSAGLVMLIHLLEHAKNQKCHIMLSFVPDELKILFQLYNVESVFEKHI
ncbi:lipid asymmetry maintenance protein MlaB [Vibrio hangzhouensis]|uniref:STAS domain-containing protein n=1 Tax=Vibrio hangzhouensis TaxID=462991 RepID=UPI001C9509CC|nr:STAS domain-containing protein [Vibrio hangzhouensis]MBY6196946.1 STAS domain-containing protein [Vibrio hangzhouensis]